jgi:hypothetical protein
MAGHLRRKQVLTELITEILCDSSEIDTSNDGRMNYKSAFCEENNNDRFEEIPVDLTPNICGCG